MNIPFKFKANRKEGKINIGVEINKTSNRETSASYQRQITSEINQINGEIHYIHGLKDSIFL